MGSEMLFVCQSSRSQTGGKKNIMNRIVHICICMYGTGTGILAEHAMSADILKELLSTYFKYIDQDYRDLKKDIGNGSFAGMLQFLRAEHLKLMKNRLEKKLHQMNPSYYDLKALLKCRNV